MDKNYTSKRIMFIAPDFYHYRSEIKLALEEKGYIVDDFSEQPAGKFYRLCKNLFKSKFEKMKIKHLRLMQAYAAAHDYSHLFIIRGEIITPSFLDFFSENNINATKVLYEWDSIKNCNYLSIIKYFNNVYTFDRNDAEKYDLSYQPLFFVPNKNNSAPICQTEKSIDLLFVGSLHGDRLDILTKLINQYNSALNLYFYLYVPVLVYFKILLLKGTYIPWSRVQFKPLNYSNVVELTLNSKAVLDLSSPGQDGITMRTFEVLSTNTKLITSNLSILEESFYRKNMIELFDKSLCRLDLEFIKSHSTKEIEGFDSHSLPKWLTSLGL